MKLCISWVVLLVLFFTTSHVSAQTFQIVAATNSSTADIWALDFCGGLITTDVDNMPPLIPGFLGYSYASYAHAQATSTGICFCTQGGFSEAKGESGQWLKISGEFSPTLGIRWKNTGGQYATTDTPYYVETHDTLDFNVALDVNGLPFGQVVTVYYEYTIFGAASTKHISPAGEINEDSVRVANAMSLNGTPQFGSQFNFASNGGVPGWNSWKRQGSFSHVVGTPTIFSAGSQIDLYLENPGQPGGFGCPIDENSGIFSGNIVFRLTPFVNQWGDDGVAGTIGEQLLFSLDLGSDCEFSEPHQQGNENFDPGDMYARSTVALPPVQGRLDDAVPFANDPMPALPGPSLLYHGGTPIQSISPSFFDLDGSDYVDFSIYDLTLAGVNFPYNYWDTECVHGSENFLISLEDDPAENHQSPALNIPSEASAPGGIRYGTSQEKDEVISLQVDPLLSNTITLVPLLSESLLHAGLALNPDLAELDDDDVDALDMIPLDPTGQDICTTWYFGADHEAQGNHLSIGPALNPCAIYQVLPGNQIAEVVNETQLGLPPGTDMADFEFAFAQWNGNLVATYLAVFFSVHPDDPATAMDETGGLDPRLIYYSFLMGASFPYTNQPMADAIDAIASWDENVIPDFLSCNQTWYRDEDGDGFGDGANTVIACQLPQGYAPQGGDCNDQDATVYPGAPGTGQGVDNNCNGVLDPQEQFCILTGYADLDFDGHGDPNQTITFVGCTYPPGIVPVGDDCNDNDPSVYPSAPGTHQCKDNNCDGVMNSNETALCQGDYTSDNTRNVSDLLLFMSALGCTSSCGCFDLNGDGVVNVTDLLLFLPLFGTSCP